MTLWQDVLEALGHSPVSKAPEATCSRCAGSEGDLNPITGECAACELSSHDPHVTAP